jgi:hypothetical protein
MSYYFHTLAFHGGDYMLHLGSLGKYMNEGLENHHKLMWIFYEHTTRGGAAGCVWNEKFPVGHPKAGQWKTDKNSDNVRAYNHTREHPTRFVMRRQQFMLLNKFGHAWDDEEWTAIGLTPPRPGQDMYTAILDQCTWVKEYKKGLAERRAERNKRQRLSYESTSSNQAGDEALGEG